MPPDRLPPMTTGELGSLGETKLSELCSQASMVSNPAKRDVHGFDNLVQVEVDQDAPAHDLAPPPLRAFIQAKATQNKSGSIGIRLTNWRNMIADSEPWFVFACEVSAEREVADVYLVHISEHWMEKALRRLRRYSAKKKKLGKNEMVITFGKEVRLTRIHGSELRQRILEAIGDSSDAYRDKKRHFYTTCGYSAATHRAQVRFPQKTMPEHYVDWTDVALGLRSELDVEHVKVADQRFDDAIVTLDAPARAMTMRIGPLQTAHVQLFNPQLGSHAIQVEVFSTAAIPHIPAALSKARLKAGPFSLFIDTGAVDNEADDRCSLKTRMSWDYDEKCALSKIGEAARAMMLLSSPGTRVSLEFSSSRNSAVELELGTRPTVDQHFNRFLNTAWAVATVSKQVGLDGAELSSADIEHTPWSALLCASIVEGRIDTELSLPARPVEESKRPVLVVAGAFPVADWVIFLCGMLVPRATADEAKLTFTTGGGRCLGIWKVPRAEAKEFPIVQKQAEIVERLEEDAELHVFSVDPRTEETVRALGEEGSTVDAANTDGAGGGR